MENKGIEKESINKFSSILCDLLGATQEELQKKIDEEKNIPKQNKKKTLCCNIL